MLKLAVEAAPEGGLAKAARALAGRTYTAIAYGEDNGRVIPCKQDVCHEPLSDPARLGDICREL
jgi:hypothetical protein